MDTYFSRVSDEELFLLMALGDVQAQDILFRRYLHLGRQIAGVFIRQVGIKTATDEDFVEIIYDSIHKAFRYYSLDGKQFILFTRDILNQNLSRAILFYAEEMSQKKEAVELDGAVSKGSETLNAEVIYDSDILSIPDEYNFTEFVTNISSSRSMELKIVAKIYLLHQAGYNIREISQMTNISVYQVRRIVTNPKKALENSKNYLKLR